MTAGEAEAPLALALPVEVPLEVTIIRPSHGWVPLNLRDLWRYHELLYFLAWRDVKVRYKQTAFGVAWSVIQPFLMMVVFSVFFGHLAKVGSEDIPYPIYSYAALVPWTYFAYALTHSGNSLVESANLITKVYFPRLVIPLSSVLAGLIDLAIAFVILIGLMVYYGVYPTTAIVFLPLFVLFAILTALAVGLWLSALNVEYRDIRYTIPFLSQIWLLATPVAYSSTLLPSRWRLLYGLNPMAGVVDGFRWALLGAQAPGPLLAVSIGATTVIFVSGLYYFRRMERSFADTV